MKFYYLFIFLLQLHSSLNDEKNEELLDVSRTDVANTDESEGIDTENADENDRIDTDGDEIKIMSTEEQALALEIFPSLTNAVQYKSSQEVIDKFTVQDIGSFRPSAPDNFIGNRNTLISRILENFEFGKITAPITENIGIEDDSKVNFESASQSNRQMITTEQIPQQQSNYFPQLQIFSKNALAGRNNLNSENNFKSFSTAQTFYEEATPTLNSKLSPSRGKYFSNI